MIRVVALIIGVVWLALPHNEPCDASFPTGFTSQLGTFSDTSGLCTSDTNSSTAISDEVYGANHGADFEWHQGYIGPGCRMAGTGASRRGYIYLATNGDNGGIYEMLDTAFTPLQAASAAPLNAGDLLRLECNSTTLTAKLNGGTVATTTDGTYTDGSAGMYINNVGAQGDDWQGFDLGGGAATPCLRSLLGVGCDDYRDGIDWRAWAHKMNATLPMPRAKHARPTNTMSMNFSIPGGGNGARTPDGRRQSLPQVRGGG